QIGMGRPREAVGAAVLAATIGVDRAVEADIGALVPRDDGASALDMLDGLERLQVLDIPPAVIEGLPALAVETAAPVGLRATAAVERRIDHAARDQVGIAGAAEPFQL